MGRAIKIVNDKKRDGEVVFAGNLVKRKTHQVLPDGGERANAKVLKCTLALSEEILMSNYSSLLALGEAIIEGDPEIDIELIGKKINRTHQLYLNKDNKIAYRVNMVQIRRGVDGQEISRKDAEKEIANIAGENGSINWSGKKFPKAVAIRQFVFVRKYQIQHNSGLTYDFLFGIAKELAEEQSMMLVGSGNKGTGVIRLAKGGENYRGFLEGRIDGDKYCLIMHLTNMEVKGV